MYNGPAHIIDALVHRFLSRVKNQLINLYTLFQVPQ